MLVVQPACTDHAGITVPYSSDLKYNITFDLNHNIGGDEAFLFNITYAFTSEQLGESS